MPYKVKKVKMIKWGWILAIILLFICNITIAVVYLVFWVAAKWYFNKDINNRIKELEQQAAENTKKNSDIINGTTNKISNSIRRNPKSHNRVGINYLICRTMLTDVFTVNENVCNCASGCCDVFGYGCTCACNNS